MKEPKKLTRFRIKMAVITFIVMYACYWMQILVDQTWMIPITFTIISIWMIIDVNETNELKRKLDNDL